MSRALRMTEEAYEARQKRNHKTDAVVYSRPRSTAFNATLSGQLLGLTFDLPYPPSTNTYWRHLPNGKTLLSEKARDFRKEVRRIVGHAIPLRARLAVSVDLYPPNKARRDIDNSLKSLCDSLQHAGVYADDSQIDMINVKRCEVEKGGRCVVSVLEIA